MSWNQIRIRLNQIRQNQIQNQIRWNRRQTLTQNQIRWNRRQTLTQNRIRWNRRQTLTQNRIQTNLRRILIPNLKPIQRQNPIPNPNQNRIPILIRNPIRIHCQDNRRMALCFPDRTLEFRTSGDAQCGLRDDQFAIDAFHVRDHFDGQGSSRASTGGTRFDN